MKRSVRILNVLAALALLLAYAGTIISPEKISWLSLFALGFPVILLINLIFIIYWLLRRKPWLYLSLTAVLLGLGYLTQFIQIFPQNEIPEDSNSFKILTYNLRLFDLYNWSGGSGTKDKIFELISDRDAPVMCFQEFYHSENPKSFPTKSKLLEMYPGISYHERFTHKMTGDQYFGIVTFSKYPIINKGEVAFTSDENNFCIYSDIVVNEDTVRVYNVHLASIRFQPEDYQFINESSDGNEQRVLGATRIAKKVINANKKRSTQTQKVLASVKQSPYPVVLCGDFNDTPVSYTYELFDDVLQDSFTACGSGIGNTYIGVFPSFRIDYVWHSSSINSAKYRTLPESYSDHHPVEVTILLD